MDDQKKLLKVVKSVLGSKDEGVVDAINRELKHNHSSRKIKDALCEKFGHRFSSSKLEKVVNKVFEDGDNEEPKKPSLGKRPKFREFTEENGESKRMKIKSEANDIDIYRLSPPPYAPDTKPVAAETDMVQSVMEQAKRMIEEKKKTLTTTPQASLISLIQLQQQQMQQQQLQQTGNLPFQLDSAVIPKSKLAPKEAEQFMKLAMDKATRAAELKQKIAEKLPATLKKLPGSTPAVPGKGVPATTLLDTSDILSQQRLPTLKVNIRAEKNEPYRRTDVKPIVKQEPKTVSDVAKPEPLVTHTDQRVGMKTAQRAPRHFAFHQHGEFVQLANRQRAVAKLEKLQGEISSAAKKTGISSIVKLAMVAPKTADIKESGIPDIEWWDSVIITPDLDLDSLSEGDLSRKDDYHVWSTISNLIEHPIQLKPPNEPGGQQYLKAHLTKKERAKIRRQNRREMQRDKTEKIRLGLEPAPPPKMKISNLMKVLGTEAVQDPTKMEAQVRAQMAKRLKKHEEANLARKLSKEERSQKKAMKLQENTTQGVEVAVYSALDLSNPSKKFKIEMNAKQLGMTGLVILHKDVNVIIVEGGPKQQKFYKRLMMNRIKWEEDKITIKEGIKSRNKCSLIWEGIVKKRAFGDIKFKSCPLEKQARETLEKHSVPHYWDMAYSKNILTEPEQD